ncbi:hypothetical protein FQN50_008446 [Emmonsiellopsis sp. PD_5]|nr:hypothetical protein FQN50_008446 [Emmonsiellopsis sp. PD_5]
MPSTTILDYLTEPNPGIDNRRSLPGLPTKVESDEPIEIMEWPDFTYDTLMACYGPVLRAQRGQLPDISPPVSRLEREIFDEDSLDHLLSRSIRPKVSESLRIACEECYPNSPDIDMTRGGRARGSADNPRAPMIPETKTKSIKGIVKTYPDWAGVQVDVQSGAYMNCCPGDTKLSTKWRSGEDTAKHHYFWPYAQLINYCGKTWNTRYGYLISQRELVVLRISRAVIGSGIAQTRSPRTTLQTSAAAGENECGSPLFVPLSSPPAARSPRTPEHHAHPGDGPVGSPSRPPPTRHSVSRFPEQSSQPRRVSVTSASSAMSVDRASVQSRQGSIAESMGGLSVTDYEEQVPSSEHHPSSDSFQPSETAGEYRPVEMKSISWDNSGPGELTVKLALWWIHMMAAAPSCDRTIGPLYPSLDSWRQKDGLFCHTTTGLLATALPRGANLLSSREAAPGVPATPHRRSGSFLLSSSPFSSPTPAMEDIDRTVRRNDG